MPFKTYYDSGFYRIEADEEGNLVRTEWLRPVTEAELVEGSTKLYEVLSQTKIERVLGNGQLLGALSNKSKDWMATKLYEMLSRTNLKKLARVMPASVFHQVALESVVTRAEALGKTNYEIKNFSDPKAALDWILS